MKKAKIALTALFVIAIFTAIISFAVCGGELISTAVKYASEEFREYKNEKNNAVAVQFYIEPCALPTDLLK